MKTVSCLLRLADDDGSAPQTRVVELSITGEKNRGTWAVVADSKDSRLKIGTQSGMWKLDEDPDDSKSSTLRLFRNGDRYILVEMYGLSGNFLSRLFCGSGWGGSAWHQGPPEANLIYQLSFLCA